MIQECEEKRKVIGWGWWLVCGMENGKKKN